MAGVDGGEGDEVGWEVIVARMGEMNYRAESRYIRGGGVKKYRCLSSYLSRCRHLPIISLLLLRDVLLSASDMRVFSVRHSWQFMVSLEYVEACFIIDQEGPKSKGRAIKKNFFNIVLQFKN